MKRIAVLISGTGSNLKNLADKCRELSSKVKIDLVVSNVKDVKGLEIAKHYGIDTVVLEDAGSKISIVGKNIADYNEFVRLRVAAEKAFDGINSYLSKLDFPYSVQQLLTDCLSNINTVSNVLEEDIKVGVLQGVFFKAFAKHQVNKEEESEVLSKIESILSNLTKEMGQIAILFQSIKKNPSFLSFFERENYDLSLHKILAERGIDYIFLAGFMRVLSPSFVDKWEMKILNIHPSLLPAFAGSKAVKEAFEYGVKITGCTVHFVSAGVDSGKIIAQMPVEVLSEDTVETLHGRIKQAEKELYPSVLERLINGKI